MKTCDIPLCPVVVQDSQMTCAAHQSGMTSRMLGLGKYKCTACKRVFNKDDYVRPQRTQAGYRHVACEPKKTRKKPTGIPLLEDL